MKYKTIANINSCLGLTTVNITIGNSCHSCELHVISNSNYELIIGLDLIKVFNLKMNENFQIFQIIDKNNAINDEIFSNYTVNTVTKYNFNTNNELKYAINILQSEYISQYNINSDLNSDQQDIINSILNKYSNIFSLHKYDIGCIDTEMCKINLTNNIPINLRPYRCSSDDQILIDTQIHSWVCVKSFYLGAVRDFYEYKLELRIS